jgi:hypothetical protein
MVELDSKFIEVLFSLRDYIKREGYAGYDPYDGLNSPLFKLPILRSNKFIRFAFQQIFRRIPINLRGLLGIKKGINPVTLGLCIQAYTYLSMINEEEKEFYLNEIKNLLEILVNLSSKGYSGFCWGYNFDWEARYTKIPAYTPTVVATGLITNGLFVYYKAYSDKSVKEILISSAKFVLNDLNRTYEGETFCFSYSPNDHQKVYNATMKGARLLAQVYEITRDQYYLEEAERTVKFVINNQNDDGSWFYSKGDARKWVDNFHTAYVLDALDDFIKLSGRNQYKINLDKGLMYYLEKLFMSDGKPKYFSRRFYPVDATELAQSVLTLTRFGYIDRAINVLNYALESLYSGKGFFYYQKNRFFTHKTSYMRWSNAYFFNAIACLAYSVVVKSKYLCF